MVWVIEFSNHSKADIRNQKNFPIVYEGTTRTLVLNIILISWKPHQIITISVVPSPLFVRYYARCFTYLISLVSVINTVR